MTMHDSVAEAERIPVLVRQQVCPLLQKCVKSPVIAQVLTFRIACVKPIAQAQEHI